MAAKSDGVLKMTRSDVAFTLLQNSEHSGSVQGLHPAGDSGGPAGELVNGESRCLGPGQPQQLFSVWDCLWVVAAVAVYLADVGTDVWLSVDYFLQRDYWWFGLTLFFVVLGSFSVQLFSFRWFVHDFSTEDSAESSVDCSHVDGNKLLSGSASHGDVTAPQPPATPQRQASTATTSTTTHKPSVYYSFCIWLGQSVLHILQLGQIWR